ncbi:hypothetical protein V22_15690 [Calycomorphotria hydatis]|uniref:Uncharacterized protein n=1 Tax=Calycomorphotria hydatis TaxID=2528027 RepID=A0A517T7I6_9PLAN|nr:hypothetical protein V22_15690 [Calycomorphotria hydatis]
MWIPAYAGMTYLSLLDLRRLVQNPLAQDAGVKSCEQAC